MTQKSVWLVFDLSNGHPGSRQYAWWFQTRQEARNHIKHQRSMKNAAKLSSPSEWVLKKGSSK